MFNIGPTELIVIVIVALIVFGPKRLPEIGRTVGKSLREFRRASQDLKDELNFNLDEPLPGDRPAPGEPGYEKWRTPGQAPSPNGADHGASQPSAAAAAAIVGGDVADDSPGSTEPGGDEPTLAEEPAPEPPSTTLGTGWTDQVWAPERDPATGSGTAG